MTSVITQRLYEQVAIHGLARQCPQKPIDVLVDCMVQHQHADNHGDHDRRGTADQRFSVHPWLHFFGFTNREFTPPQLKPKCQIVGAGVVNRPNRRRNALSDGAT